MLSHYSQSLLQAVRQLWTIRSNRKFFTKWKLSIALWQDTKIFMVLSTNSQANKIVAKSGERQLIQCPELIAKYNENMGGVGKNDLLRQ